MAPVARALGLACAASASLLAAAAPRRLQGLVTTITVNGQSVDVFADALDGANAQATAADDGSMPPFPAPLPRQPVAAAPARGTDITYAQMGLIIGLVVGTLFIAFLAVVGYIVWDLTRERRRRRALSLQRSSGSGSTREAALLSADQQATTDPNSLPAGHSWIVHEGMGGTVGLELDDTDTGEVHKDGSGGGSRAHAGFAATLRGVWGALFGWDWRKQVSQPLDAALESAPRDQPRPPRAVRASRAQAAAAAAAAAAATAAAAGGAPQPEGVVVVELAAVHAEQEAARDHDGSAADHAAEAAGGEGERQPAPGGDGGVGAGAAEGAAAPEATPDAAAEEAEEEDRDEVRTPPRPAAAALAPSAAASSHAASPTSPEIEPCSPSAELLSDCSCCLGRPSTESMVASSRNEVSAGGSSKAEDGHCVVLGPITPGKDGVDAAGVQASRPAIALTGRQDAAAGKVRAALQARVTPALRV